MNNLNPPPSNEALFFLKREIKRIGLIINSIAAENTVFIKELLEANLIKPGILGSWHGYTTHQPLGVTTFR